MIGAISSYCHYTRQSADTVADVSKERIACAADYPDVDGIPVYLELAT
jgi:hypothetical protein